eukprot:g1345.t1
MLASPPLISRGGLNVQANWEPLGLGEGGGGHPFHKGSRRSSSKGPGQVPIGINPSIQAQSAMLREMYPNVAMGGPGPDAASEVNPKDAAAAAGFSVGDKVMALFEEEEEEYEALVQCDNGDETYLISWTEAEQGEEHVFKEGDKVQAFYEDDQDYYEATVQKDHGDGTFLVSWDGDGEEHVAKRTQLKLLRLAELDEGTDARPASLSVPSLGLEVQLSTMSVILDGGTYGQVRKAPKWWGEDANLAAGVLVACEDGEAGARVLLGIEDRPWWPQKQAGPFWGFVEPTDADFPSAMAREATEETLDVLGGEAELRSCLQSDIYSAPVCCSPWHKGPNGEGLQVLRLVSLGSLKKQEQRAVQRSFLNRRSRALVIATATVAHGCSQRTPPPHLEVEELHWCDAFPLLQSLEAGQPTRIGTAQRPLRGFVAELLQEDWLLALAP